MAFLELLRGAGYVRLVGTKHWKVKLCMSVGGPDQHYEAIYPFSGGSYEPSEKESKEVTDTR